VFVNEAVEPDGSEPYTIQFPLLGTPFAVNVVDEDGAYANAALAQLVPVLCPTVAVNTPAWNDGLEQRYPDAPMHEVPEMELGLKTPNVKSADKTTAIIKIAQPYVIRYSMALCAFSLEIPFIISFYYCLERFKNLSAIKHLPVSID
jgi:hypothetical protein